MLIYSKKMNKLKIWKLFNLTFILTAVFSLFSCVTMQDDVYVDNFSNNSEVADFEKRFSELDAVFYDTNIEDSSSFQQKLEAFITEIDYVLKDFSLKKAVVARLYALEGLAYFESGNKSQAKKFYELSIDAFKGDARSFILAYRLSLEKNLEEKLNSFSDKSLLVLETALTKFSEQDYASAVAKFDEAFLSLDTFYREAYGELRNTSWALKNLPKDADSRNISLLSSKNLTVMQMLLLANQKPDLLYNHTVGKKLSDKELYAKIAGSGLLNPVSQPLSEENALSKNSTVTRLIAARFLWNLYNEQKNTQNQATKYSKAFANKKRSPIPDVRLDSPDFDAALGCVENEIMHLEDGIDFGSEKEVSGLEFDESVNRLSGQGR